MVANGRHHNFGTCPLGIILRSCSERSGGPITVGATEIIFAEFLSDVASGNVILVPMQEAEEDRFRDLVPRLNNSKPPLFTRTLDGIHVATAELHGATEFVCTDLKMRKCAEAIGLSVYP